MVGVSKFLIYSRSNVPMVIVVVEIGIGDTKVPKQEGCESAELHLDKVDDRSLPRQPKKECLKR